MKNGTTLWIKEADPTYRQALKVLAMRRGVELCDLVRSALDAAYSEDVTRIRQDIFVAPDVPYTEQKT